MVCVPTENQRRRPWSLKETEGAKQGRCDEMPKAKEGKDWKIRTGTTPIYNLAISIGH